MVIESKVFFFLKAFESFGSVHIEGAEFINMGQTQDKGNHWILVKTKNSD